MGMFNTIVFEGPYDDIKEEHTKFSFQTKDLGENLLNLYKVDKSRCLWLRETQYVFQFSETENIRKPEHYWVKSNISATCIVYAYPDRENNPDGVYFFVQFVDGKLEKARLTSRDDWFNQMYYYTIRYRPIVKMEQEDWTWLPVRLKSSYNIELAYKLAEKLCRKFKQYQFKTVLEDFK